MKDFLGYIRKRRAELQQELRELEIAERVYRECGIQMVRDQVLNAAEVPLSPRKSIKQMIIDILSDMHPHGLTALELVDQIGAQYGTEVKRTSLSPQLTRLKNEAEIVNDRGVWKRPIESEGPDTNITAASESLD